MYANYSRAIKLGFALGMVAVALYVVCSILT